MRRWIFAIITVLVISSPAVMAQNAGRILAVINEDIITLRDVTNRMNLLLAGRAGDLDEASRNRMMPQILRSLIDETLQLQELTRTGVDISESDVNRGLAVVSQQNSMTLSEMFEEFEKRGINRQTLENQTRAQLGWLRLINGRFGDRIRANETQIDAAANAFREGLGKPEHLLAEIVLPIYSPIDEPEVTEDARKIIESLQEGDRFANVARQVSTGPTAQLGGDLGWVRPSSLSGDYLDAVNQLEPGRISNPIRTPSGIAIVFLRESRIAGQKKPENKRLEVYLSQLLFPLAESTTRDEARAIAERANDLRSGLNRCSDVRRTADRLSLPASGDLGWLKVSDLPESLSGDVKDLKVNEISPPLLGPAGIHLLMVCERRNEDKPIIEDVEPDRGLIRQRIEAENFEIYSRRYLRDLRDEAFIDERL